MSLDEQARVGEMANTLNAVRSSDVNSVHVVMQDVSYTVPLKRVRNSNSNATTFTILHNIHAAFCSGQLTALLGPSGSGKSTLLDVLAGRKKMANVSGTVRFNGQIPSPHEYRNTVGYVEQFDTLVAALTVERMLQYTAALKLPRGMTASERQARVEEVIRMLHLESCRHTTIGHHRGGISGGQAKRVNIGLALLTRPPILLLDEPTSGLDSRAANQVVHLLQRLAHDATMRRTIVCTLHAPTGHALAMVDHLYMIHQGRTIYDGPLEAAQAYFEAQTGMIRHADASLPEWLVDITSDLPFLQQTTAVSSTTSSTDGPQETTDEKPKWDFAAMFQASQLKCDADAARKALLDATPQGTNASSCQQDRPPTEGSRLVTLLTYRALANYTSPQFLGPRFGDKILFGLLILSLYYGIGQELDTKSIASISSFLFFLVCLCGFGAAAFVPTLNLERRLFYRELDDGCYAPTTYYLAKFVEEAVLALATSAVFCLMTYFGLDLTGSFGIFFVTYYLTTLIGIILAYAVASIVPSL